MMTYYLWLLSQVLSGFECRTYHSLYTDHFVFDQVFGNLTIRKRIYVYDLLMEFPGNDWQKVLIE